MSFLSIDILLTGLQEPEYVVGTRRAVGFVQRAVGLFQRVVGWHLRGLLLEQQNHFQSLSWSGCSPHGQDIAGGSALPVSAHRPFQMLL